ncbi:hypothetical protein BAE44_0009571 [Dichanthelium oligosanthes]|uniref:Cysteine proteinase inhibitor n=1 Tax=Dichanthelium oligosanthes TaxID=888268 RepID=A0A1E5VWC0_9POAL|nr:hypothetical protein BAE44_0009571 [Dichanthelium oligosanthes]
MVLMHRLVYNKEFTLVDVISVSMQPAGNGNNYFVVFKAADKNKKVRRYQALVWGNLIQQHNHGKNCHSKT